jgi:hypothetical protein
MPPRTITSLESACRAQRLALSSARKRRMGAPANWAMAAGARRPKTQTEGRHIPRCSCGGYRRLGIGQHRRLDRCDAQGPSRIHVLDLDTPSLCHPPATAECDAPPDWVIAASRLTNRLSLAHLKSEVPAANQRPEPVVARFAHPCF